MTLAPDTAPPVKKRLNARTKAILAIVAGSALLLGGGGTYAYWSTQVNLGAGTVQSGDLNLSLGSGSWSLKGVLDAAANPVSAIGNVRIVPGDVLTLTQPLTVTLVGTTIAADLKVDTTTAIPAELAPYVTVSFTSSAGTATGNTWRITPATAGALSTELKITFNGTAALREGVNQTIDLSKVGFTLTQASS